MKPDEKAHQRIDKLLLDADWTLQDCRDLNLGASLGVAAREFSVSTGFADYLLFVDRNVLGTHPLVPVRIPMASHG